MTPRDSTAQPDWTEVPEVRRQIDLAAKCAAQAAYRALTQSLTGMMSVGWPHVESPLEAIFVIWWESLTYGAVPGGAVEALRLSRQHEVDTSDGAKYRLDFVVVFDNETEQRLAEQSISIARIAVEVDGHAFHEKTREQVAYRNQRDRDLQRDGWLVFHFSWSELVNDGESKVSEVITLGVGEYMRCQRDYLTKTADAAAANKAGSTERGAT